MNYVVEPPQHKIPPLQEVSSGPSSSVTDPPDSAPLPPSPATPTIVTPSSSTSTASSQLMIEKTKLSRKIREYNRKTTPVHHIHIKSSVSEHSYIDTCIWCHRSKKSTGKPECLFIIQSFKYSRPSHKFHRTLFVFDPGPFRKIVMARFNDIHSLGSSNGFCISKHLASILYVTVEPPLSGWYGDYRVLV